MEQNSFKDFLKYTVSAEDVSLAVAKDTVEQVEFLRVLKEQSFIQVTDILTLLRSVEKPGKVFYLVTADLPKEFYEFINQYSGNQLGIFNTTTGAWMRANQVYTDVSVVFVITEENLGKIRGMGFSLFDKVGLIYKS